jgi:hypothetical protein
VSLKTLLLAVTAAAAIIGAAIVAVPSTGQHEREASQFTIRSNRVN